jgi:hypothetical protein
MSKIPLWKWLSLIDTKLSDYEGTVLGVDISQWYYALLAYMNTEKEILAAVRRRLQKLLGSKITPLLVADGPPSQLKFAVVEKRRVSRQGSKPVLSLSQFNEKVRLLASKMDGVRFVDAKGEADQAINWLIASSKITGVLTNDVDAIVACLVMNKGKVIRMDWSTLTAKEIDGAHKVTFQPGNQRAILQALLKKHGKQVFVYLSAFNCDYNKTKSIGHMKALKILERANSGLTPDLNGALLVMGAAILLGLFEHRAPSTPKRCRGQRLAAKSGISRPQRRRSPHNFNFVGPSFLPRHQPSVVCWARTGF